MQVHRPPVHHQRPKLVSLGDSLTAGMRNGNLGKADTQTSFPSLLADQVDLSHQKAALSGNIVSSVFRNGQFRTRGAVLSTLRASLSLALPSAFTSLGIDAPNWSFLPSAYLAGVPCDQNSDNLGIPGLRSDELQGIKSTQDLLQQRSSGKDSSQIAMQSALVRGFCHDQDKPASVVDKAVAAKPDIITLGVGSNDVMEAVLTGRLDDKTLQPVEDKIWTYSARGADGQVTKKKSAEVMPGFRTNLNSAVDRLLQETDAEIMLMNIVDITKMPLVQAVGQPIGGLPFAVANFAGSDITDSVVGKTIPDKVKGDGLEGRESFPKGSKISLLTLLGDITRGKLGRSYREDQVLDPDEIKAVRQRITDMNQVIAEKAASSPRVHLVDIHGVIEQAAGPDGLPLRGEGDLTVGAGFAEGKDENGRPGLFSMDGMHPAPVGYGVIANRFLETAKRAAVTRPKLQVLADAQPIDEIALTKAD